jgi:hypothetical protein
MPFGVGFAIHSCCADQDPSTLSATRFLRIAVRSDVLDANASSAISATVRSQGWSYPAGSKDPALYKEMAANGHGGTPVVLHTLGSCRATVY